MSPVAIRVGSILLAMTACMEDPTDRGPVASPFLQIPAHEFRLDAGALLDSEWAVWRVTALVDTVVLSQPARVVEIEARGTPCKGTWPLVECTWNGRRIGRIRVNRTEWARYPIPCRIEPETGVLRVALLNDRFSHRCDLNLFVRTVSFSGGSQ